MCFVLELLFSGVPGKLVLTLSCGTEQFDTRTQLIVGSSDNRIEFVSDRGALHQLQKVSSHVQKCNLAGFMQGHLLYRCVSH